MSESRSRLSATLREIGLAFPERDAEHIDQRIGHSAVVEALEEFAEGLQVPVQAREWERKLKKARAALAVARGSLPTVAENATVQSPGATLASPEASMEKRHTDGE